jgi:hypothetical protein
VRLERLYVGAPAADQAVVRTALETAYLSDVFAAYGHRPPPPAAGCSFAATAEQIALGTAPRDEPVDLVILAHADPDPLVEQPATCALHEILPGRPLGFAVTDQGAIAPFTALRLAEAYGARRALVLAADSGAMVAMTLRPAGDGRELTIGQFSEVEPGQVAVLLEAALADRPGEPPAAMIAGSGLAALPSPAILGRAGPAITARAGDRCTGVWSKLAMHLAATSGERVIVADYEPSAGQLGIASLAAAP